MSCRARLATQPAWELLAAEQEGVISVRQLVGTGLSRDQARQWARTRRWTTVHPGVFAHPALTPRGRIWAAVLHCGPGAMACGPTVLWLAGAIDTEPASVHVAIPADRKVEARSGIVVHRTRHPATHPVQAPPRTRLERAVLDCCAESCTESRVVHLILGVTQRRLTTPARLLAAMAELPRHRWRKLIVELLDEVDDGVTTPLELRYKRDVERAHHLPRGTRNTAEKKGFGPKRRNMYRDVRYLRWRVVAELDGRAAHPEDEEFRDMDRDNLTALSQMLTLRYGWRDVVRRPCQVAGQVGAGLRLHGWDGRPTPCGPGCQLDR